VATFFFSANIPSPPSLREKLGVFPPADAEALRFFSPPIRSVFRSGNGGSSFPGDIPSKKLRLINFFFSPESELQGPPPQNFGIRPLFLRLGNILSMPSPCGVGKPFFLCYLPLWSEYGYFPYDLAGTPLGLIHVENLRVPPLQLAPLCPFGSKKGSFLGMSDLKYWRPPPFPFSKTVFLTFTSREGSALFADEKHSSFASLSLFQEVSLPAVI